MQTRPGSLLTQQQEEQLATRNGSLRPATKRAQQVAAAIRLFRKAQPDTQKRCKDLRALATGCESFNRPQASGGDWPRTTTSPTICSARSNWAIPLSSVGGRRTSRRCDTRYLQRSSSSGPGAGWTRQDGLWTGKSRRAVQRPVGGVHRKPMRGRSITAMRSTSSMLLPENAAVLQRSLQRASHNHGTC